jgi:signal transduction histidine kinase
LIRRLRASFAAKLLALELGSIVAVAVALAAVLVAVRVSQTRELERNVAQANVQSLEDDLRGAGTGAMSLASRLAAQRPLAANIGPTTYAAGLLDEEALTLDPSHTVALLDATGRAVMARRGSLGGTVAARANPSQFDHPGAIASLDRGTLPATGVVEPLGGRLALDGVAPVRAGTSVVGYVIDSIDVEALLQRVTPSASAVRYSVFYDGRRLATTLIGAGPSLPPEVGGGGGLTTSFASYQIDGHTYAGYYGTDPDNPHVLLVADLEDSIFAAQNLNDLLAAFFAVGILSTLLGALAVIFASRVALRPLAELDRGASRLGAGDLGARVEVAAEDELGRLARSFNAMADHIRDNTRELEEQRGRLDASLTTLAAVSGALTTTTAGETALRGAVLEAVMQITSTHAAAMYGGTEALRVEAATGMRTAAANQLGRLAAFERTLDAGGGAFSLEGGPEGFETWSGVVVPMIYQDRRVGAIAVFDPFSLEATDLAPLAVLANQAIVALENSEMFQRERQTVVRLQELDSMKSDFLATIQHELRTPLTAIIGITDLLEMAWEGYAEEQKRDMLTEVQVAAKTLYDTVETILDYSLLESDRLRLAIAPTELRPAVESALDDLGPAIRRRKAKVDLEVPRTLRVEADGHRLAQMVRVLVDNAVKFGPSGGKVKVSADREDGLVRLRVADRGVGIAPEHLDRIFERFYQVDNTATRRHGGTGMGLALARKLVTLHGGRLLVESEPGKGSTFTLLLPASGGAERDL